MLGLLALTAALAATKPQALQAETPPPNTCIPTDSCRYVPTFVMRSDKGPVTVKMNGWSPIFKDGLLPLFPGDTVVLAFDKPTGKARVLSLGRYERLVRNDGDTQADQHLTGPALRGKDEVQRSTAKPPAVRAEVDTIRLSFYQVEGKTDTVLRIDNGYSKALVYSAGLSRPGDNGIYATNVCPVGAGELAGEAWPEPLSLVVLRDFKLADVKPAQAPDDCR